jgi:hypothetical protein
LIDDKILLFGFLRISFNHCHKKNTKISHDLIRYLEIIVDDPVPDDPTGSAKIGES